jgi:glucose-1-phosphate cytidylyltransferase
MKTVILCGGKGTRMGKDLQGLPKALINIGDKPIIWHIMKYYSYFGFNDFILCLGYKGKEIFQYFRKSSEFKIKFLDTGFQTNTGGRLKQVQRYIDSDVFFATYGDGLSNINLKKLLKFHLQHRKIASLVAVRPRSTFGIVSINAENSITHFIEKPLLDHWVNGGFFVFTKEVFKYLKYHDVLEKESFSRLVNVREVTAYKHYGFWECMDTYKDNLKLNQLWALKQAPWAAWRKK